MAQHVLQREQFLPILWKAWRSFSTPRDLAVITPPEMGFAIRLPFDDMDAYAGQRNTYTVKPLLAVPLPLATLIEGVEAPLRFVGTQVTGSYERWWHEHTFEAVEGGIPMRDRVEYQLTLGPLGDLAHAIFVRQKLNSIIDFRNATLERMFSTRESTSSTQIQSIAA